MTIHLSRIDLNLFVVFDAIYTEGGITRASKRLSLTQPAISHALGRLRELFDDPLFMRQGKAMIPTPMARVMIDPVRAVAAGLRGYVEARRPLRSGDGTQAFHGGHARRA